MLVLQVQSEDVVRPGVDQPEANPGLRRRSQSRIRNPLTAKKLALSGARSCFANARAMPSVDPALTSFPLTTGSFEPDA